MNYIYGNGHDGDEASLKGAIINDGEYIQNIYVGLEFCIEDFTGGALKPGSVSANRALFKLTSDEALNNFLNILQEQQASRVIYFPQDETYMPLAEFDIVVPWVGSEKNSEVLDNAIKSYYGVSLKRSR